MCLAIMCMSPSSLGNCTIYSTWCIRYAQSCLFCFLYNIAFLNCTFFHLLVSCPFFADFSNYSLHRPSLNTMIGTSKHQKRRVNETIILPRSKTVQVHCSIGCASTSTCTNVRTLYMHVHTIVMVRTDDIRTERVNEEILLGRTLIPFISSCTIMLVMTCIIMYCKTDMHQDYSEEISIPPKEKAYFHAKLQVLLWSYFFNPRNVCTYVQH